MGATARDGTVGRMLKLVQSFRRDGWYNVFTGLGQKAKDKRLGAAIDWAPMVEQDAENLYAADDIAERVVDIVPDMGTREWIEFRNTEAPDSSKDMPNRYNDAFEQLKIREKFQEAWAWARLYGGAGVFIAVDDGKEIIEPLEPKSVRQVKSLTVLSRYELTYHTRTTDIANPNFGLPETYQICPRQTVTDVANAVVHHSRIIRFDGARLPRTLFETNALWHDSVLNRLYNVLRNFNLAHDSAASVIQDFRIGILKLKNLADMIGQGDDAAVISRIELMNMSKSIMNTVVLDAEDESFEYKMSALSGIGELLKSIDSRLVAATGLPHTIILGEGAAGFLSGAGESENKAFFDVIASQQSKALTCPIDRIFDLLSWSKTGPSNGKPVKGLTWQFNPLWQMTSKEQAELHKVQAEADGAYIDRGVLDVDEVANSRFAGKEYSIETSLDLDARAEQKAARESEPEEAPPQPEEPEIPEVITDAERALQTVVISKNVASTLAEAKKLLEKYGGESKKVDETETSFRFRQRDPGRFIEGSFRSFKPPKSEGVTLVYGALKG